MKKNQYKGHLKMRDEKNPEEKKFIAKEKNPNLCRSRAKHAGPPLSRGAPGR